MFHTSEKMLKRNAYIADVRRQNAEKPIAAISLFTTGARETSVALFRSLQKGECLAKPMFANREKSRQIVKFRVGWIELHSGIQKFSRIRRFPMQQHRSNKVAKDEGGDNFRQFVTRFP